MGGDGGTIGSTRRYMRGAGSATTTADATRHSTKELDEHKQDHALQSMRNCSLTGSPLDFTTYNAIVACPYGRLYNRESAVEALLRRKQTGSSSNGEGTLGEHVRGLKDLYPVRFQVVESTTVEGNRAEKEFVPVCPVTGTELNGTQPPFLIVKSKLNKKNKTKGKANGEAGDEGPNVISERVLKEMRIEALQSEFGPFVKEDMIRLAPPTYGPMWEEVQAKVRQNQEQERLAKAEKGDGGDKKRKKQAASEHSTGAAEHKDASKKAKSLGENISIRDSVGLRAVEVAKVNASSAISSSSVLSSLFVRKDSKTKTSY